MYTLILLHHSLPSKQFRANSNAVGVGEGRKHLRCSYLLLTSLTGNQNSFDELRGGVPVREAFSPWPII